MSGRVTEEITEERKEVRHVPRATHLIGPVSRTKEAVETMAKARVGVDLDFPTIAESKRISWTNSMDQEDDQGSSWESESENAGELASVEALDEGEWCWPRMNRITRW